MDDKTKRNQEKQAKAKPARIVKGTKKSTEVHYPCKPIYET